MGPCIAADAQDGGGNSANFATPPDGQSGRMRMYRFTRPTIDRDGSLDAEIVLHETDAACPITASWAMRPVSWIRRPVAWVRLERCGILSLLNNTSTDDPNGKYASGAYAAWKRLGVPARHLSLWHPPLPYSTDISVNH